MEDGEEGGGGVVNLGEAAGIKQSMDEAVYSTEIPKAWPPCITMHQ